MIIVDTIFGGVVDPTKCWVNSWCDNAFHEWGSNPDGTFAPQCRITYTPAADGKVLLLASPKQRFGNVDGTSYYGRAYGKARIVQISPTYKNDFVNYTEGVIEINPAYPIVRFLDPTMPLMAVANLTAGTEYVFTIEQLAGDNHLAEVDYGCPFVLLG